MPAPIRETIQYKGHDVTGVAIPAGGQFQWEVWLAAPGGKPIEVMTRQRFFPTAEAAISAAHAVGRTWLDGGGKVPGGHSR